MTSRLHNPPARVLIHGLTYFSRKFPALLESDGWEIRNYGAQPSKLPAMLRYLFSSDLAFTWGGRLTLGKFLSAARWLNKQKLVMFWCGSDTLEARSDFEMGRVEPWIAAKTHWAGAPWLADEIRAMGLRCEFVPATWVCVPREISALPAKFSVLAYLPDASRVSLYGIDHVLELARQLPHVAFTIVGLQPGQTLNVPANVSVHGWTADMTPYYVSSTALWRPVRHDGLSFTALEALSYGRHVLWSYPFTGSIVAGDVVAARPEIERLRELHEAGALEPNYAGARYVAENYSQEKTRERILTRWRKIVGLPDMTAASVARMAKQSPSHQGH